MLEIEKYIKKHVGRKVLVSLTFLPSPSLEPGHAEEVAGNGGEQVVGHVEVAQGAEDGGLGYPGLPHQLVAGDSPATGDSDRRL